MNSDLGIAIVASPFDWLFAKGTIASCRHYLPGQRITLLVDGQIDTQAAERKYGISVLDRESIQDPELRRLGFGWGTTKMLFFWYARSETFLYLDSDAVLWGDLRAKLDFANTDYFASVVKNGSISDADMRTWYFEIPFVEKHFPEFAWRQAAPHFFCPGVFAARRGVFDLAEYKHILRLNEAYPGQFKFGDMGFHNLMVFRSAQQGRSRVKAVDFQVIFPEHSQEALRQRFRFDASGQPVVNPGDEQVLHMPDQKPLVDNPRCYSEPMTFFRLQYLKDTEGMTGAEALRRLRVEDVEYHVLRAQFLRQEKRRKILGLLRGHPGEWRRLFAKLFRPA